MRVFVVDSTERADTPDTNDDEASQARLYTL